MALNIGNDWITTGVGKRAPNVNYSLSSVTTAGIGKVEPATPVFEFSSTSKVSRSGSKPVTSKLMDNATDVLANIENFNSAPASDLIDVTKAFFGSKSAAKSLYDKNRKDATILADAFNKQGWQARVSENNKVLVMDEEGVEHEVEDPGLLTRLWNAKGEVVDSIVGAVAGSKAVSAALKRWGPQLAKGGNARVKIAGGIATLAGYLLGSAGAAVGSVIDMEASNTTMLNGERVLDDAKLEQKLTRGLEALKSDMLAGAAVTGLFAAAKPIAKGASVIADNVTNPVARKVLDTNKKFEFITTQGAKDSLVGAGVGALTGLTTGSFAAGIAASGLTKAGFMGFRAWDKSTVKAMGAAASKIDANALNQAIKEGVESSPELKEKANFLMSGLQEVKNAKGFKEKVKAAYKFNNDSIVKSDNEAMKLLVSETYKDPERIKQVQQLAEKVFTDDRIPTETKTLVMALIGDPNGMEVIKRVASNFIGTPGNIAGLIKIRDNHIYETLEQLGTLNDIPAIKTMAAEGVERYRALVAESYKTLDEFTESAKYTTKLPSDNAKIDNYNSYIVPRYAELINASNNYIASNMAGSEISSAANKLNNLSSHTAARYATGNAEQKKRMMLPNGDIILNSSDLAKMKLDLSALPEEGLTKDIQAKIKAVIKDIDEELELKFTEAIRESNGAFTNEHRELARELLNNAVISAKQVEALKTNSIYKVFTDELADTKDISSAIIKATEALDSSELANFLKFIPKEEVKKVEGIIINAAAQKSLLQDADKQILDMLALNGIIKKYNFKSAEAQAVQMMIDNYATIFRSDKPLLKYLSPNLGTAKAGVAQGLTANLFNKLRIFFANRTWKFLMEHFGRETSQKALRMAKVVASVVDNPNNATKVSAFKEFIDGVEKGEIKDFTTDDLMRLKHVEGTIDVLHSAITKLDDMKAEVEAQWKATADAGVEPEMDKIIEEVAEKTLAKQAEINEAAKGTKSIPAPPKASLKQNSEELKALGRRIAKAISIDDKTLANPDTIREMALIGVRELQEKGIHVEPASVMDMAVSYYNKNKKGDARLKMSKAERAKFVSPEVIEEQYAKAKEVQAQAKATRASQEAAKATPEPAPVEPKPEVISAAKPARLVDEPEPVKAPEPAPEPAPIAKEPEPMPEPAPVAMEPKVEKPKKASTPKKGKVSASTVKKADKIVNDKYQQIKFTLTGMDDMDLADPYTVAMEISQVLKREGLDADTMYEVLKGVADRIGKEEGIYIPVIDKAHFVNNIYGVDL